MRYTLDFENGVGQRRLVSVFSVEDADHSDVFREAMLSLIHISEPTRLQLI